jgi:hypothetical protein
MTHSALHGWNSKSVTCDLTALSMVALSTRAGGSSTPLSRIASGTVLALAALVVCPPAFAADSVTDLGPGCAPDRPATAHYAGGVAVANPNGTISETLIPCVVNTFSRTSEIGLVITNNGTILFRPGVQNPAATAGSPIGVLRSVNRGASWESIDPSSPGSPANLLAFDGNMGIDRQTGRAFGITPGYEFVVGNIGTETPRVDISDTDGKTWFAGGEPISADSMKIFAGPPPARLKHLQQGFPKGYPNVIYNCGGHKPQRCERSRDGGLTWGPEVALPIPPELAPIQGPKNDCSTFALNGAVTADGTVYVGYSPCNRPYVAISNDEGDTWKAVQVANLEIIGWGMTAVGVDGKGNVYSAFMPAADRLPYLSVSQDKGLHWSKPLMIGAPGLNEAALPRLMAGVEGQVAVAYYGSHNSPGAPFPPPCPGSNVTACPAYKDETWNLYITETFNALDPKPLFWSAPINSPAQPAWYGCSPSSLGVIRLDESSPFVSGGGYTGGCVPYVGGITLGGRQDYFGMDLGPDNTPWVGFSQGCPNGQPVIGNPNCPGTLAGLPADGAWGLVGRLVRLKTKDGAKMDADVRYTRLDPYSGE